MQLHRVNGDILTFVSLYRRPHEPLLAADLRSVVDMASVGSVVIGADLNDRHSYWGHSVTNQDGKVLYNLLLTNLDLHIRPTCGP